MKKEITPDIERTLKKELKHQNRMAEIKISRGNLDSADFNIKKAKEIADRLK
ncbi:MAG: hypothetical protein NC213_04340 [Acetobacter sp.]|nr:hypothetical protein [Bacteroides sp.]MCM1340953.1 hypothetical protein [Acetobacter sp.]MCM1432491.1 hypothetical protein [Clostridiales bacterium]